MNRIQDYEGLVRELTNDLNYHKYFLELLEKVEIKRKKDGTHFANKNQTFVNGKIVIKSYNDSNHPSFEVSGICSDGRYRQYDFEAYLYIDDMRRKNPNDERIKETKDNDGFWRNTYLLTTDEIIERIEKEKERQKEYIANYEKQINASKEIFDKVTEKLDVLKNTIYENCKDLREDKVFCCSLEYALANYVTNNIK